MYTDVCTVLPWVTELAFRLLFFFGHKSKKGFAHNVPYWGGY
jgi:hypothetical protein